MLISKHRISLKYLASLLAIAGVVAAAGGCRIAQKGKVDDFDEADARKINSSGNIGAPAGFGGRAISSEDPRVSLVNAPCGNSPDTEVFLARSRTLKLSNQLGKLPASSWKLTASGRIVSVCSLMAARELNLALFFVFPSGCASCAETIRQAAGSLAALQKKSGPAATALSSRIVAIESGAPEERSTDLALPIIYAADPTGQLLRTLSSNIDRNVMPIFVVHRSGYGFFSNTPGAARDSFGSDFEALARDR